jgi:hypothetical protein
MTMTTLTHPVTGDPVSTEDLESAVADLTTALLQSGASALAEGLPNVAATFIGAAACMGALEVNEDEDEDAPVFVAVIEPILEHGLGLADVRNLLEGLDGSIEAIMNLFDNEEVTEAVLDLALDTALSLATAQALILAFVLPAFEARA